MRTPDLDTHIPTITVGETTAGPASGDQLAGEPFTLPVKEILQGRAAVLGKSGSGKSNTVSVLVEELLAAEYPVLIFDADGEYVSLKEEYRILHVGGAEYCEQVIGPEHAGALAEIGIEQREAIIVDLAGYAEHEADAGTDEDTREEMVAAITSAFFEQAGRAKREYGGAPYLLVAEEIHEFVPQQGGLSAGGRSLVKVAKRGRKRGLGVCGLSQRPADVDKAFITQCDLVMWHRLTWSNDTDVVRSVLGSEYADAVEGLADGEAFVLTDWDDSITRVQMRRRRTTDLGQAPGLDGTAKMDLKAADTSILDELDAAAEQARTKDQQIQQLQRETEELRDERDAWQQKYEDAEYLADISADVTGAQFQDLLEEMSGAAASQSQAPLETATIEFDDDTFEVPEVIEAEVLEIREEKRAIEGDLADVREERDRLQERVDELEAQAAEQSQVDALRRLRDDLRELVERNEDLVGRDDRGGTGAESSRATETPTSDTVPVTEPSDPSVTSLEEATRRELVEHAAVQRAIEATAADAEFSDEWFYRAMDILAASDGPLSAQEVATMTTVSDSTMRPVLQDLNKTGIVESIGERPERFTLDRDVLERRIDLEDPDLDHSS